MKQIQIQQTYQTRNWHTYIINKCVNLKTKTNIKTKTKKPKHNKLIYITTIIKTKHNIQQKKN